MRILNVRDGKEPLDIAVGRGVIHGEISQPSKNLMLIRGNNPDVAAFADRCDVRSKAFGWRETIWIQDDRVLDGATSALFGDAAAVVLGFSDKPVETLSLDADLLAIEQAFLRAQGGGA